MKEYTIIGSFYYNSKNYELLLDDEQKYYFLEIKNGKYEYITLKEYVNLINKFSNKQDIKPFLGFKKKENKKIKLIPRILIGTTAVLLSLSLLLNINNSRPSSIQTDYTTSSTYTQQISIEDKTDQEIEKYLTEITEEMETFQIDTIRQSGRRTLVYDFSELDGIFNNTKEDITYNDIRQTISNNSNISEKYKQFLYTFVSNLENQYPTMDLRVWNHNLKTLKIKEVSEMEMQVKAISANAYACYRIEENTIYTVKGYDYVPGTWEYQVIMHELGHTVKTISSEVNGQDIKTYFKSDSGNGTIVEEAMNTLFTVRSYDNNEMDLAYQLQSNMIELMVNSMDNYTYQDYIEHNITYFEHKLNEHNNNNEAVKMIGLIDLQYDDYHDNSIAVDQIQFHELYDYIAKMYYDANIRQGMSQQELTEVKDNFIYKLSYDVPEDYNIDINHINEYFDTYCQEHNISYGHTK